ncbi:hypothetical protein [Pseudomonas sp. 460]|uniref:hypothetical protein n=1 Tax=Pseudomonas sp. 460 TaxID=2485142 RepID=UPI00104EC249|nr:hypothetical protein [Pseudomonas sp. 460]TCV51384.1 hypothetical protein EDB99_10750 [Pseudomonas sp. 460]
MDIDTVVLFGKDGREESFGLSAGSREQVAAEIERIIRENPWAIRYEFESDGREVDAQGEPIFDEP